MIYQLDMTPDQHSQLIITLIEAKTNLRKKDVKEHKQVDELLQIVINSKPV